MAALPAAEQVEEVRKELMRRNSGFDGTVGHKIEDGAVMEIHVVTEKVTDIAPIRVWSALRVLDCHGTWTNMANGLLADLRPLEGSNLAGLTDLNLSCTKVGDAGLVYFKGMPLRGLLIYNTGITDLTPLQGMPLKGIRLTPKNITRGLDILRDMKSLKTIGIRWDQAWPAAEFWERYDKGEFED
jgi:hypothetical protein